MPAHRSVGNFGAGFAFRPFRDLALESALPHLRRTAGAGRQRKPRVDFRSLSKEGAIIPGSDADLIVVDLKRRAKITKGLLRTR